jgi:hypothetical protein
MNMETRYEEAPAPSSDSLVGIGPVPCRIVRRSLYDGQFGLVFGIPTSKYKFSVATTTHLPNPVHASLNCECSTISTSCPYEHAIITLHCLCNELDLLVLVNVFDGFPVQFVDV